MTAMQELLIHFNEKNESGWFTFDEVEQAILEHGMPIEKQQIKSAFVHGTETKTIALSCDSENYYNETYGNEATKIKQV